MAKKDIEIRKEKEKRRPSRVLMHFYMLFLAVSLVVIGKIIYIQYIWEPNPKFVKDFKPAKQKEVIEPERGSILDHNGRLLAISTPLYNIRMDCYVQKEHNEQDGKKDVRPRRNGSKTPDYCQEDWQESFTNRTKTRSTIGT